MNDYSIEKLVKEMKRDNLLTEKKLSHKEFAQQLIEFQYILSGLVLEGKNLEHAHFDEVIFYLEAEARKKDLMKDPEVRQALQSLRKIDKEIRISIAGRNGESRVARTLEYISRPNTYVFQNVYIANKDSETEIDDIILTNEGIIILEVKNAKEDITISEDGRLLYANEESFHETSIHDKMQEKRKLLTENLQKKLDENNLNIPISIESFIVFSVPKEKPRITDNFHKEKWCFRGALPFKINDYIGKITYSQEQIDALKEILGEMKLCEKRFDVPLDFEKIRNEIAIMLVKIFPEKYDDQDTKEMIEKYEEKENDAKIIDLRKNNIWDKYKKKALKIACFAGTTFIPVVGAACALTATTALMVRNKI